MVHSEFERFDKLNTLPFQMEKGVLSAKMFCIYCCQSLCLQQFSIPLSKHMLSVVLHNDTFEKNTVLLLQIYLPCYLSITNVCLFLSINNEGNISGNIIYNNQIYISGVLIFRSNCHSFALFRQQSSPLKKFQCANKVPNKDHFHRQLFQSQLLPLLCWTQKQKQVQLSDYIH